MTMSLAISAGAGFKNGVGQLILFAKSKQNALFSKTGMNAGK
jgi:hypothetical protein